MIPVDHSVSLITSRPSKLARVTHKDEEISKNSKSRFIKNEPFNDFEERPLIAVDKSPRKYQTKIVEPEALNDFEAQLLQADSHLIPRKKKRHGRTRDHILDPEDIQRTLEITTKTLKPIASIHHVGIRQPNPSSSSANPSKRFEYSTYPSPFSSRIQQQELRSNDLQAQDV